MTNFDQLDIFEDTVKRLAKTDFGTEPFKLVRRGDPKTSVDAACTVKTSAREKLVYEAIKSFGDRGCIIDDVRDLYPHLPYSTITARPAALIEKGLIVDTGRTRQGHSGSPQRILKAV